MKLYDLRDSVLRISYELDNLKSLIIKLEVTKDELEEQKVKLLNQLEQLIKENTEDLNSDILGDK
ncbi:hypothetical protein [Geminocystis herdmanii]|uniref:hypothetical protein n=1 Tax=Geminocystis herdmanii TaxID=669359 RepID=UPI0003460121|nr:hypothetical protein [Geminocystis herdmanii]